MAVADVVTEDSSTLAVPPQARTTPTAGQAAGQAVITVPAGRLGSRYWQAVARYVENYSESQDDGPAYRSPAQADAAAARFGADAEAAAQRALRAQREARSAAEGLDAARAALERAPAWQWRVRGRLRAGAAREDERRAAALRELDEHSARMESSLREARRAGRIATVLRRSDRAHLAAADAAARALGWRPGDALPSRATVYVAGPGGVEPLPAITQR